MRRQDRQINDETELSEILCRGKFAVLALCRDDEPYIVTLSYGFDESQNALYMHTGTSGMKIDILKQNPNVCATIIDDRGYAMDECGHEYRTIVIHGKISFVTELEAKMHGMLVILNQLEDNPTIVKERSLNNPGVYEKISILKLDVENISGKKGR
jgi:nitroimidazol reductase NimA-like FMN-containing flavoprotein (pyridoxamine 5'-phosphate oxidase superfamily)